MRDPVDRCLEESGCTTIVSIATQSGLPQDRSLEGIQGKQAGWSGPHEYDRGWNSLNWHRCHCYRTDYTFRFIRTATWPGTQIRCPKIITSVGITRMQHTIPRSPIEHAIGCHHLGGDQCMVNGRSRPVQLQIGSRRWIDDRLGTVIAGASVAAKKCCPVSRGRVSGLPWQITCDG